MGPSVLTAENDATTGIASETVGQWLDRIVDGTYIAPSGDVVIPVDTDDPAEEREVRMFLDSLLDFA